MRQGAPSTQSACLRHACGARSRLCRALATHVSSSYHLLLVWRSGCLWQDVFCWRCCLCSMLLHDLACCCGQVPGQNQGGTKLLPWITMPPYAKISTRVPTTFALLTWYCRLICQHACLPLQRHLEISSSAPLSVPVILLCNISSGCLPNCHIAWGSRPG